MDNKREEQSESVDWEAKAAEFEAGWKRAVADLDNYRKDTEKRQVEMMQYLKAQSLMEMLSMYDDLDRVAKVASTEAYPVKNDSLIQVLNGFKEKHPELTADDIEDMKRSLLESSNMNLNNVAGEGLRVLQKKILNYLKAQGLEEIRPQAGDDFDPEKAEAISVEENAVGENKVIETVETGIEFNGKVIKPAKVRVGK